jgi:hypothetical protein
MADYYPLIAKAVSGLEKSTGEARRALYDRARQALLAQLRGVEPALAESDITRERLALEEAIRKVETEAARRSRNDPPPARAEPSRPEPPSRRPEPAPARAEPPLRPARQPIIGQTAAAAATLARPQTTPSRPSTAASATMARPTPERRQPAEPLPPAPAIEEDEEEQTAEETAIESKSTPAPESESRVERNRWNSAASSLSDRGLKGFRDVVTETETLGSATAQAAKKVRAAYQPRAAPPAADAAESEPEPTPAPPPRAEARTGRRREPRVEPAPPPPAAAPPLASPVRQRRQMPREAEPLSIEDPAAEPIPRKGYDRDTGPSRPASRRIEPPPPPDEPDDIPEPDNFVPPVKPEYPTRPPSSMVRQEEVRGRIPPMPRLAKPERKQTAAAARRPPAWKAIANSRVLTVLVLGILAIGVWLERQHIMALVRGTPGVTRSADATLPADSTGRTKIADRIGSGGTSTQRGDNGALVAQKAVLYEEDANDPNGRQFVGSAVWRTDRVPPGPGQAPEVTIRADVEIPDQHISLRWSLRRNQDKALPASHTVEIMLTLPPDFSHGGIQNIPGVLMKQGESTRGVPLAGLAVKVTANFFLIGLSSVDADMQRNIQLLKERPWFDIPLVYGDGQRAIIAIEKGTPGERVFAEAFAAWEK